MNSISRILLPFDFSEVAVNSFNYTMQFCVKGSHTVVELLYVDSDPNTTRTEASIKEAVKELDRPSNVELKYTLVSGEDMVTEILKKQKSSNAELIIMGTKGASQVSERAVTNTSNLTQKANCPVIVVPQTFKKFKLDNITLSLGKGEIENPSLLSTLLVIARRFSSAVHVLTIYGEDDKDYLTDYENEGMLKYYLENFYSFSSAVRSKNIAASIIDYDKSKGIDMLAIIPRNHDENGVAREGALTKFLTMNTNIPLLTIG